MPAFEIQHTFSYTECASISQILKSTVLQESHSKSGISNFNLWQLGCLEDTRQFITYGFSIEVNDENTQVALQTVRPFFDHLNLTLRLSGPFIGISPKAVTKGNALIQFLASQKIALSEVIGIGDGGYINGNDVSFLSLPHLTAVYVGTPEADKRLEEKANRSLYFHFPGNTKGSINFLKKHQNLFETKKVLAIDVDGTVATEDPLDLDNCILDPQIHSLLLEILNANPNLMIVFVTARGNITYVDSLTATKFNTKKLGSFFNMICFFE